MLGSFDCQLWSWITSCEGIKCEEGGNNPPPPPRSFKGLNESAAAQASVASGCSINKTHGSGKTISSVHACGRHHTHTHAHTHTLSVYTIVWLWRISHTHTHTHACKHTPALHPCRSGVRALKQIHTLWFRYSPKSTSSWWRWDRCGQAGGGESGWALGPVQPVWVSGGVRAGFFGLQSSLTGPCFHWGFTSGVPPFFFFFFFLFFFFFCTRKLLFFKSPPCSVSSSSSFEPTQERQRRGGGGGGGTQKKARRREKKEKELGRCCNLFFLLTLFHSTCLSTPLTSRLSLCLSLLSLSLSPSLSPLCRLLLVNVKSVGTAPRLN